MAQNVTKQLCKVDCGRAKCINGTCMVYSTMKQCYSDLKSWKQCAYCGNWSDIMVIIIIACVAMTIIALPLPIITWLILRQKNISNIKRLLRDWDKNQQKMQQTEDRIQVAEI